MPTRKVELTDNLDRFVAAEVESGRFGDAGEAASLRYESLIGRALRDLSFDPERSGSKEHSGPMFSGAWT